MKTFAKCAALGLVATTALGLERDDAFGSEYDFESKFESFAPVEDMIMLDDSHPFVGASTIFPTDGWGITDFVFGLLIGGYAPIQARWRNYDCRSRFYNLGVNIIGYSRFFDLPFDVNAW